MRTRSQQEFRRRLEAASAGRPLKVHFELTYACNWRCVHCYVPRSWQTRYRRRQLGTAQVLGLLDQLRESGCFYLGLTGGEPFTRPDIIPIIEHCCRLGFQLSVYTNASLIGPREAERLAGLRIGKIDIHLPGISERSFAAVTRAPRSRDGFLSAVRLLRSAKLPLGFKSCVLKENRHELAKMGRFAGGVRKLNLDWQLFPRWDGSRIPLRHRFLAFPGRKGEMTESGEPRIFRCGAGEGQCAITPAGELKLCTMINHPLYPASAGFERQWQRLAAFTARAGGKSAQCFSCALSAWCGWCPARSWITRGDFISCDPECRSWAKAGKEG